MAAKVLCGGGHALYVTMSTRAVCDSLESLGLVTGAVLELTADPNDDAATMWRLAENMNAARLLPVETVEEERELESEAVAEAKRALKDVDAAIANGAKLEALQALKAASARANAAAPVAREWLGFTQRSCVWVDP